MGELLQKYADEGIKLAMGYAPKLLLAILTLIIGLWLVGRFTGAVRSTLERRNVDATLVPFVSSLISWLLKALVFISVASMVGIKTTSFIAILGAAGLAVGLALQGSLANFAGGVLILIFRPYRVGDLISAQGELGVVKEIQIFTTTLLSPENKRVIIPNGPMANGNITNFTSEGVIRVDMMVGISYSADIPKAKSLLLDLLKSDERVLEDPAPVVAVAELGDSSVNLAVRPFCDPEVYWDVKFDMLEGSKRVLDEAGISIPFPQRDVHLYKVD